MSAKPLTLEFELPLLLSEQVRSMWLRNSVERLVTTKLSGFIDSYFGEVRIPSF
jgi:hypothetical protein